MFLVHVAGHPTDGAALAGRITPLEQDDHARPGLFQILLHRDQLGLVGFQVFFTLAAPQCLVLAFLQVGDFLLLVLDLLQQILDGQVFAPVLDGLRIVGGVVHGP